MAKGGKSSASAGTRKKHAKKAHKEDDGQQQPGQQQKNKPLQRGQKKLSKAQQRALPKIKQYIPPPKPPAPTIPDPLDGQGLARTLPAELVVVLRRLGKKDDVTRRKGLEELRDGWVADILRPSENEDDAVEKEIKESTLVSAVPVWLHNLASLLQSPFHRTAALQLHAELLSIPSVRAPILSSLSLGLLPGTQRRDVLGSWLVAALEEGRRSGGSAIRCWDQYTEFMEEEAESDEVINLTPQISSLSTFLALGSLDPPSLHDDIHPAPVSSTPASPAPTPQPGGKGGKATQHRAGPHHKPHPPREPTAEEIELANERWARYRVGGLVGLAWILQQLKAHSLPLPEELIALVQNPALWSSLSSQASEDGSAAFGYQFPSVRRAAYSAIRTLLDTYPDQITPLLPTLAKELLESCWLETEAAVWDVAGETILQTLKAHPELWTMDSEKADTTPDANGEDEGSGNESEEDDNDDEGEEDNAEGASVEPPLSTVSNFPKHSIAFDRFLEFISTICPTVPHLTYPLLLVVISSLPATLLPLDKLTTRLESLFAHLWSAVDARLLPTHSLPGQPSALVAFLRDAVDCISFLIAQSAKQDGGSDVASWLVKNQLGERVWKEGVIELGGKSGGRRGAQGVKTEQEATIFGQALARLSSLSPELTSDLLEIVSQSTVAAVSPDAESKALLALLPRVLYIITATKQVNTNDQVVSRLDKLVEETARISVSALSLDQTPSAQTAAYAETLTDVLRTQPAPVSAETKTGAAQLVETSSESLVSRLSPDLYVSLVEAIASTSPQALQQMSDSWGRLASSSNVAQSDRFALAKRLLAAQSTLISSDIFDSIAEEATLGALESGDSSAAQVAASCVATSTLSSDGLHTVLALVTTSIHNSVHALLTDQPEARLPTSSIDIFAAYAKSHVADLVVSNIFSRALVDLHHIVVLLPRLHEQGHLVPTSAMSTWESVLETDNATKSTLNSLILADLASLTRDVSCRVEPDILVDVALVTETDASPADVARRILPGTENIQQLVAEYTSRQPETTLPIIDPLIPYPTKESSTSSTFDPHGRSKAARLAEAALGFIKADRKLSSTSTSLLQTVLSARALAQDGLYVPGASRGFLDANVSVDYLAEIIREAEGALSFSLAAFDEVTIGWHKDTVELLKKGQASSGDFLQQLIGTLVFGVKTSQDDVAARTLRDVLARHLRQSGAGEPEAEVWLNYGMTKAETDPTLSLALLLAVKPTLMDSKAFATAQNRLANSLAGVPAKEANAKGIPALRLLIASAPSAESTSLFIPQQRAIFVMRHVASWLTSEEGDDLDEEVETRLAELYTVLAPIVQDVEGAHWDSIFDLIETGLDSGSLEDRSTLGLVHQCLVLLQQVRDLCSTNKALRAAWTSKKTHLSLVLKLFLQCRDASSEPMRMVQDLILDLLQDASDDVVGDGGLPQLSKLLGESTWSPVQTTAYRLLSQVIKRRTLALILEVETHVSEVEEEGKAGRVVEIPAELVDIVTLGVGIDWHQVPDISLVLGQLLAWMAILDHFDDASRTLRWAYLDQLNSSDLLSSSLIPMLWGMLGVSEVGAWNFAASQFAVDEFYPDLLLPEELADLTPLASYVYYRALVTLPSAVRTYYEGLKDRQLSMSMLNFTARYYSPVIIQHEFAALREPAAMAQLTEEGLQVRIAQGGGATVAAAAGGGGASEAIASYVVDEQPMEIGIRLPAEFPLRGVDVRDLRRVGVPENKWRGWLMSVQQTITSRNGLILDALTIFKKNVSLHFEGVVECAICYSIISLTDRSLPTKPCRTCKNRFHASCLYKWFNSSHSSSCPLCRALF